MDWVLFLFLFCALQVNGIMTNTGHSVIFYTGNWDEENGSGGIDSEATLAGLGGVRGISDSGFLGGSSGSMGGGVPGGGGMGGGSLGMSGMGVNGGPNGGGMSGSGSQLPKTLVNITGGPLSYRYQFHEIHIHYGMRDEAGSEHTVDGYAFPAEVRRVKVQTPMSFYHVNINSFILSPMELTSNPFPQQFHTSCVITQEYQFYRHHHLFFCLIFSHSSTINPIFFFSL